MRAAIVGVAIALVGLPSSAWPCSMATFGWTRHPRVVHFIATPTADTVFTGQGDVVLGQGGGHSGPGSAREIYGQVMAVDRIGEAWHDSIPPNTSHVILVPWDYDPSCEPLPWNRSARWATATERSVYHGWLRDRADWVDGVPTLDVFAARLQPYPSVSLARARMFRMAPEGQPLSVDDYLDLRSMLPYYPGDTDPLTSLRTLEAWVAADSVRARWPVSDARESTRRLVSRQQLERLGVAVAGTYRVEVTARGSLRSVFHLRTEEHFAGTGLAVPGPEGTMRLEQGELFATHALLENDFLTEYRDPRARVLLSHRVALDAELRTADSTVWRGWVDAVAVAERLEPDATRREQWKAIRGEAARLLGAREGAQTGRWVMRKGQPIEYTGSFRDASGVLYDVRAVQRSYTTIR